jgi:hypothetical protein
MIGNDIIDLKAVSAATTNRRQRFLDKICIDSEQEFLYNQQEVDGCIWLLWSMKESAWKAHYRNSSTRKFNPKFFHCKVHDFSLNDDLISGLVSVENKLYNTSSFWNGDLIHTITHSSDSDVSHNFFNFSSENSRVQSLEVRNEVCQFISRLFNYPLKFIIIEQNECGVPQIIVNGVNSNIQLSISHHGRFGAYAICYEDNISN